MFDFFGHRIAGNEAFVWPFGMPKNSKKTRYCY